MKCLNWYKHEYLLITWSWKQFWNSLWVFSLTIGRDWPVYTVWVLWNSFNYYGISQVNGLVYNPTSSSTFSPGQPCTLWEGHEERVQESGGVMPFLLQGFFVTLVGFLTPVVFFQSLTYFLDIHNICWLRHFSINKWRCRLFQTKFYCCSISLLNSFANLIVVSSKNTFFFFNYSNHLQEN